MEEIRDDVQRSSEQSRFSLRLALHEALMQEFFPPLLAGFHQEHPALSIHLTKEDNSTIEDLVMEGNADFGFLTREPQSTHIKAHKIVDFPFALIGPKSSAKLALSGTIEKFPLFVRSPCQLEAIHEETNFFTRFPATKTSMPINCYYTLRKLVESEMGLAFIPSFLCRPEIQILETFEKMVQSVFLVYRKGIQASSFQQTFLKWIKKTFLAVKQ